MKAVILAGGKGTRLKPITNIINKHLLPVGKYPMIYWPIQKLKQAGIREILIVTNKDDVKMFKDVLGNGEEFDIALSYCIQEVEGGGIANALSCARDFVSDKFIVTLGDNLFNENLKSMMRNFIQDTHNKAKVLLKEVDEPDRYGIAIVDESNKTIVSIQEKPEKSESKFCVTGIYFYDKQVLELIDSLLPSQRGELEITDLNNLLIDQKCLSYDFLTDWWLDAGTFESLFEANKYFFTKEKKEIGDLS